MPILSNVLIEPEKGNISLTTTNLDLGTRCKIKAEVKEPAGTLPSSAGDDYQGIAHVDVSIRCGPKSQLN